VAPRILCGEKKRPGGKLVRVCASLEGGRLRGLLVTGDFFAEDYDALEERLEELARLEAPVEDAPRILREALGGLEIHGVTVDDVVEALERALAGRGGGKEG